MLLIKNTGVTFGNIIQQDGSNASGRYVGAAGTASGNLTITNSGVGYTPSSGAVTYQNVSLNTITGHGRNATANLTISNGVASAATILSGGSGYVIGDVVGATAIMFDDETDTGGLLTSAAEAVILAGAKEVYACSTHGIFSGKANDRISNSSILEMIVTDTVPQAETTGLEKVSVITIAPLLGEAINRIYSGQSVGAMFDGF